MSGKQTLIQSVAIKYSSKIGFILSILILSILKHTQTSNTLTFSDNCCFFF